jgi:hypothetical protein
MRYRKCMWSFARKLEEYSSLGSYRHGGENYMKLDLKCGGRV